MAASEGIVAGEAAALGLAGGELMGGEMIDEGRVEASLDGVGIAVCAVWVDTDGNRGIGGGASTPAAAAEGSVLGAEAGMETEWGSFCTAWARAVEP